jgi:hypothetical protein
MSGRRLVLCGGLPPPRRRTDSLLCLDVEDNVNIKVENVARVLVRSVPARLLDLLEIAAYIFAADCSTRRGATWRESDSVEEWSRHFHFRIPVRDHAFWSDSTTVRLLSELLSFIADDDYEFDFRTMRRKTSEQMYLEVGESDEYPFQKCKWVTMFSGGLDSLAGAMSGTRDGSDLLLVSHRSEPVMTSRLASLVSSLKGIVRSEILHVPIWVNKTKGLDREHSQRTRAFLFSALGTVVGAMLSSDGVRFFENGIVSVNLPIADEVLRARASRTTHPLGLQKLSDFYTKLLGRPFLVENPFFFKTKADVVSMLREHGVEHLIAETCSCAHQGFFKSNQRHCGTCSQCIDRRVAVIAAGVEPYDPVADYVCDVFTGERKDGYEKNMAVNFARHVNELSGLGADGIAQKFNVEISRVARAFPRPSLAAQEIIEMHQRYARCATAVLDSQVRSHASDIVRGSLPANSLLALLGRGKHLESSADQFCARVTQLLANGVPRACRTEKPANELRLQEICDGILNAHEQDLQREFPFVPWSAATTKPDWSNESLRFWIEAKYVREKSDIRQITEDIAADITKYGDNGRKVLYFVYDPSHFVVDEQTFARDVLVHGMKVSFIR